MFALAVLGGLTACFFSRVERRCGKDSTDIWRQTVSVQVSTSDGAEAAAILGVLSNVKLTLGFWPDTDVCGGKFKKLK